MIAARGTSDNAGRYAQYVWGTRNGLSVGLTTPSLLSVYDRPPRLDGGRDTRSGESPDIVSVLDEGRQQGRPTVAITNEPDSPLADAPTWSSISMPVRRGPLPPPRPTRPNWRWWRRSRRPWRADRGPSTCSLHWSSALAEEARASEAAAAHAGMEVCAVLGRGFNQATAFEWALKLQELTQVVAQPFSTADFLHGRSLSWSPVIRCS